MPYSVEVDRKWQKRWRESDLYRFHRENAGRKFYCLEMFSYPSGANLHVGHWYNFALADSYARMKRMQGFEVFHPMGFDAFGLPAENYAIKTGIHPQDSTLANIKTMEEQLREMGATFDWEYELATCTPEYYKWNQWLFLKLYERGLAYRKLAPVNWCPACQTVLANEQVEADGACERCGAQVTKKNLTQWFFKITDYAQELLDCLPALDWPDKTKKIQQNWIGRSEGAEITFSVASQAGGAGQADGADGSGGADGTGGQGAAATNGAGGPDGGLGGPGGAPLTFKVFTTRPDTLYGVTYMVLAPESPLVDEITAPAFRAGVEAYREEARKASEIDRMSQSREKTGVPTGAYAINPVNQERVPIWIADYVLATYGTGCVMAVPGHDERDFEFATKFGLPIRRVIAAAREGVDDALPFCDDGALVNSERFDGMVGEEARRGIVGMLAASGEGAFKVNYRLRDWLVSRQRYWGTPIPMVYCERCGAVPVPEGDLPVLLPYDVAFTPDGESPLKKSAAFMDAACPSCGGPARRDPDTLDTFVCSSWYYLRYLDNRNDRQAFDPEWAARMTPVDIYVGGAEHAAMHLLYARFVAKALRDMGYVRFDEPFKRLVHQGVILGADGNKMSKSLGNTVSPDEYVHKYGSDVFRMYLGFGFAYTEGGPWSDAGIKAIARFVARLDRLVDAAVAFAEGVGPGAFAGALAASLAEGGPPAPRDAGDAEAKALDYARHYAVKAAGADIERFQFNTAIARLMEMQNALTRYEADVPPARKDAPLFLSCVVDLLRLVSPFAPHFAEESWARAGLPYSIFNQPWPRHDERALQKDVVELAVQVNGTVRFKIEAPRDAGRDALEAQALGDARLEPFVAAHGPGAAVRKVVVVPGRLVNVVVK
jgi:leucyl-tRNA synthetase